MTQCLLGSVATPRTGKIMIINAINIFERGKNLLQNAVLHFA